MPEPERLPPEPEERSAGVFWRWLVHIGLAMAAVVAGHVIFRDAHITGGMIAFVVMLTIIMAAFGAIVRRRGPGSWP